MKDIILKNCPIRKEYYGNIRRIPCLKKQIEVTITIEINNGL
jgi:hypothetical protein